MRLEYLKEVSRLIVISIPLPFALSYLPVCQFDDDNSQLVQLLSLCDLLVVTCEGNQKHAIDICQGIFEIDELIRYTDS